MQSALSCVSSSDSKNPFEIFEMMLSCESVCQNGPEHHTLVGAALLIAYANAGGDVDLDASLAELTKRSLQVPGGACGFWGTCGAAVSAGQFYSIVSGSTPMKRDAWGRCQRITSNVLARLADYGGPRCCKRGGLVAISEAVPFVRDTLGVEMELPEELACRFSDANRECIKTNCPYWKNDQPCS